MQLDLFTAEQLPIPPIATEPDLDTYDYFLVMFSGGKDSMATVLDLLEQGVPKEKIELWHHDIDDGNELMDWPCTTSYCKQFAREIGITLYLSAKEGGFKREMLRENQRTAPIWFETPTGISKIGGTRGKLNTRRKFPQVSGDLRVRWCSAYLKIDVGSAAIRNQPRFCHARTLVITGERGDESTGRANYKTFEPDRSDNRAGRNKRHVDHWRNVHDWHESKVWEIIERWKIVVHPAYYLGWGRCSCSACIFGSKDQWASLHRIHPAQVKQIAALEIEFDSTIHRSKSVMDRVEEGTPYPATDNEFLIGLALSQDYNEDIFTDNWILPAGAFGESCGAT